MNIVNLNEYKIALIGFFLCVITVVLSITYYVIRDNELEYKYKIELQLEECIDSNWTKPIKILVKDCSKINKN